MSLKIHLLVYGFIVEMKTVYWQPEFIKKKFLTTNNQEEQKFETLIGKVDRKLHSSILYC